VRDEGRRRQNKWRDR